ncbi:MAG: DNA mismatch repair protein MutL [Succiniclasticum sp.]|jgi:DNA mismatch repair protein MutL
MQEAEVRLLDTNTSNQIAAGEVVEKPASVVKELVENSLDAGADSIDVTIFEGGTEYIRVADNGTGMNESNARLAMKRHATSKIRAAADLNHLHTLGFRGEALPSIASVSEFELLTRTVEDDMATSLKINGGAEEECLRTGGPVGTTVIVKDLFYNVPARRKFLKTVSTEGRYVSEILTRIALARPDVHFRLTNNDKEVLATPGNGSLKDTIAALYGKSVAADLLPVSFDGNEVSVHGYIGKPTLLKGNRSWQTLLVNGRSINSPMLSKAIEHAYQSQIPKRGFAFAVLDIRVAPDKVDVNVHPQKSEVKFSDDGTVYKAVYKSLADALTRPMHAEREEGEPAAAVAGLPQGDYAAAGTVTEHRIAEEQRHETGIQPSLQGFDGRRPTPFPSHRTGGGLAEAARQSIWNPAGPGKGGASQKEPVYSFGEAQEKLAEQDDLSRRALAMQEPGEDGVLETIWPIGQVDKTFIIAQSDDTLYLIDQHAAHERILYDKLVLSHQDIPAQQLLIPQFLNLQPDEVELLEKYHDDFYRLGVDVTPAGDTSVRVDSLPADIPVEEAENFIRDVAQYLQEHRSPTAAELRQDVLHMAACRAAIKAGQLLNMRQMRQLLLDLCNTTHPFTCPHGRPCMIAVSSDELYKLFKRTGFDLPSEHAKPYDK